MGVLIKDYTTSNAYSTGVQLATDAFRAYTPKAPIVAREKKLRPGETSFRVWSDNIIGKLGAYSGSGNFNSFAPGGGPAVTATADARVLSVELERGDWDESKQDDLVDRKLAEVAGSVARTLDNVVFEALAAAFSTTYSDGTGTPYIVDNGSTLHTLKDGTTTQSNNVQAALSETSLQSAITKLARWKNYADNAFLEMGSGPKALIVPPELEFTARKLTGSSTLGYNNGGAVDSASNPLNNEGIVVITTPFLSNTSRWFLIDIEKTPIWWSIITPPRISIRETANHTLTIECSGEWGCVIAGPPNGLIGSSF